MTVNIRVQIHDLGVLAQYHTYILNPTTVFVACAVDHVVTMSIYVYRN